MSKSRSTEVKGLKACFDTNFLIYSVKQKTDLMTQLKDKGFHMFLVPDKVVLEVERLINKLKGKDKIASKIVLELIKKEFEVVETECEIVDDSLIEACLKHHCYLFTNDRVLIKRAKKRGIPIGYLRGWETIDVDVF